MQTSHHNRTSSRRSSRHQRDSPDYKESTQLIASKFGDLSQRGLIGTNSRELDNRKVKNPAENTEYIRNLYKKYLGKENTHPSERKTKTDAKDLQLKERDKNLVTEACCQKLTYGAEPTPKTYCDVGVSDKNLSNSLFKKASEAEEPK